MLLLAGPAGIGKSRLIGGALALAAERGFVTLSGGARVLGRLAEQAPVALALDDLHWADTATVELLHYLARGVGGRRMLLVGAYRSDEAEVEPPLRALVGDLRRAGSARSCRLPD